MTSQSEDERIAAGLSDAQRRAVLWRADADPKQVQIWCYRVTMDVLDRMGLLVERSAGWGTLSPLGLLVRDHLLGGK